VGKELFGTITKLTEDPIPHDSRRIISEKEKIFRIRVCKVPVLYRNLLRKLSCGGN
jgi:hypothetical protein